MMQLTDKAHRQRSTLTLPMTSMIDVVFLLLIFFLVTANFSEREDRVTSTIQSERAGASASQLQPQIVSVELISGRVGFRIGERVVFTNIALRAILEQLPKDAGIAVKVDDHVPIQAAATALQAAHDAGFTKRSYVPSRSDN
ncbi:MAG: biopolymer transporter ExbD [Phycisphaeraceae bacterium]|nr:biopolymer transporter ExbD [Phycisphaeraceae bacterium]MCW5763300.1 biopolymer transporter ExbD [Phycisphaeraceae bacterium]